jgi:hypothetical protein
VWDGEQPDESIALWREHEQTVNVFIALSTQWHRLPSGALAGLRYESLLPVMRLLGVKRRRQQSVFHSLRVMERSAVAAINDR